MGITSKQTVPGTQGNGFRYGKDQMKAEICRHSQTQTRILLCNMDGIHVNMDHKTETVKQSTAQSQTMWAVIRPVQAVTEDTFIWTVRSQHTVNCP